MVLHSLIVSKKSLSVNGLTVYYIKVKKKSQWQATNQYKSMHMES